MLIYAKRPHAEVRENVRIEMFTRADLLLMHEGSPGPTRTPAELATPPAWPDIETLFE